MNFGSLFSGIGGMDLGLERAGMACAWQVENDPFCNRILRKHWPDVPRYLDVRDVAISDLAPVDLICGGVPCQPFSTASAGKRRGTSDDRWLWPEMRRLVQGLKPRYVLVENVRGFDGPGLEQVVSDLEASDYEVLPPLEVPACAFGYDHWRPRIWILAYSDNKGEPGRSIHAEVAELPRCNSDTGSMGVEDGIPRRMDRMKALGNAAHVDIAEWVGRNLVAPGEEKPATHVREEGE